MDKGALELPASSAQSRNGSQETSVIVPGIHAMAQGGIYSVVFPHMSVPDPGWWVTRLPVGVGQSWFQLPGTTEVRGWVLSAGVLGYGAHGQCWDHLIQSQAASVSSLLSSLQKWMRD